MLVSVTLFCACAEDTVLDYDNLKPHLAVQSRLTPDSTFKVTVFSTIAATDPGVYRIPEGTKVALIDVTYDEGPLVNLYYENGNFVDPKAKPLAGHAYKIFVNAPGFQTIEASTTIPEPVEVESWDTMNVKFVPSDVTPDKMNLSYELSLRFKPTHHQYFHVTFIQSTKINEGTVTDPDIHEYFYFTRPQFPNEDGYYEHHEEGVLVDMAKAGKVNEMTFSFVDYTFGELEELGNLYVEVRTVSKEYYLYYTSLARQLVSREDPFAEPISVYSNVLHGSGNLSGYSTSYTAIRIMP